MQAGTMSSVEGALWTDLWLRHQDRGCSRAAILSTGCEGSGRRGAAERSMAEPPGGLGGHLGTSSPRLRRAALTLIVRVLVASRAHPWNFSPDLPCSANFHPTCYSGAQAVSLGDRKAICEP